MTASRSELNVDRDSGEGGGAELEDAITRPNSVRGSRLTVVREFAQDRILHS